MLQLKTTFILDSACAQDLHHLPDRDAADAVHRRRQATVGGMAVVGGIMAEPVTSKPSGATALSLVAHTLLSAGFTATEFGDLDG